MNNGQSGYACQDKYKSLSKVRNTCPMITLLEGFGYARGQCHRPRGPGARRDRNQTSPPVVARLPQQPQRAAGRQVQVRQGLGHRGRLRVPGQAVRHPGLQAQQTTSGKTYTCTKGAEITDSVNVQVTVSAEFFEVVSTELSTGYEHSETSQGSFSSTTDIGVEQGSSWVHYFPTLFLTNYSIIGATGHVEGDCANEKVEPMEGRKWCAFKLTPDGEIDGNWESVDID
ncbi:hypothetical protein PG994_014501 [Apiospora phragmitis]|uniref:Uncharacterized protein n=1 Tax=Apiospora phragmitis TaxID=2905665 RepID=A0ABR1T6J4_9PEZI